MHQTKKPEKPPSLLTKTENQRLNSRKPANRGRHQNRKTAVFKCENLKTEPKIGQIRKTENPNAPLCNKLDRSHVRSFFFLVFDLTNLSLIQIFPFFYSSTINIVLTVTEKSISHHCIACSRSQLIYISFFLYTICIASITRQFYICNTTIN